ncbi:LysR family transcriptional regulator [Neptunomonas japonica]|uniref:LysR family transcriptional regulator n=1 Tax=Neptunomonas japonica JAMM 1380 TaxID=1441457 RepID=A0A7R6SWF9_9GAMM|nr:LysR family transcriptional regulator [Neptunomonas japonica]BBB30391.1 LysR family transcriptional regulator [Neptunomonas japonica JAMM 1380]
MTKADDMALFVRVVKEGGLAVAGRQLGISAASMTARIKGLEERYGTRLLHRTTRSITLTSAGQHFYEASLRVLAEMETLEIRLQQGKTSFCGVLRVTAPSDFGRQYVAPALAEFVEEHKEVQPYLNLADGIVNLVNQGFDLGVRFGNLPDSNLVVRQLIENHRVLCAAPKYLRRNGTPKTPEELKQHRCLVMERLGEPLNEWRFTQPEGSHLIKVHPAQMSNDGGVIREWALAGAGIALKSWWDIKNDIERGALVTLLDSCVKGFQVTDQDEVGLQMVYPSRQYTPLQVTAFIEFFKTYMAALK